MCILVLQTAQLHSCAHGEDERSLRAHFDVINREMDKLRPDLHIMKDAMERTLALRRSDMQEKSTESIIQVYSLNCAFARL